jgi:NDP-sugar pyrophosphorylase family protein
MKAVILAGGKGARLAPYTKILPKPLLPINDMPILEIMLRQMSRYGIGEVILTVGHLSHLIETFFQDGSQFGLKIRYSYEECPLGTAGPLSLIRGLDETFFVTNGDVLTTLNYHELLGYHLQRGGIATVASQARNVKIDLGVIERNENDEIVGYTEKPTMSYFVSMGIYVFEPGVLSFIPPNEYLDFPDLVLKLLAADKRVVSYPFDGYWKDLGRADDYEQAVNDFERIKPQILGDGFCLD